VSSPITVIHPLSPVSMTPHGSLAQCWGQEAGFIDVQQELWPWPPCEAGHLHLCFFCFCFCGTGVWIQDFMLAKQSLYLVSHFSNPFCSAYLKTGGLTNFSLASLEPWSSRSQTPK
jgi:hypothetical protein